MWTVIYITSNEKKVERIRNHLETEGFLIKVEETKSSAQFEILVLESEIREVQEELNKIIL